ncbi:MAG: ribonuclease [Thermoleophilales bacterium]|nr:ribonuclease [Thermoleophilales bacterium]
MRKKVLVTADRGETRVAILEAEGEPTTAENAQKETGARRRRGRGRRGGAPAGNGANGDWKVAELYIERRGNRSIVGNVYKGKVDNVLPGLEAAFVDIGLDKNGFLHVDDIVMPGVEIARRGRVNSKGKRISELLKPGQEILVQVMKDPLKTKGARLSMQLSIAGRYLVHVPDGEGVGVSRRLSDKERDRLRKETKGLDLQGGGAIIRTAAAGAKREDFEREIKYLFKLYELLKQRAEKTQAPAMVFQEADLSVRVVRDIFSDQFEKAIVDDEKQHHRLISFFTRTAPELVDRVERYDESDEPLFEAFDVEKEITSTLSRRVDLPSGGYLIIDYAEAMTVIDINSGSFTGRGKGARLEDTITKTNLEAADEVVRQLRLRDIGGIIVIDFIDMARAKNRDAVLKTLRNMLEEDRTKTYVMEVSPLGLVEMTRQNVTDGVREILTKTCPTCDGEGVVLSEETVALQVERWLRDLVIERPEPEAFLIQVHPSVSSLLINGPGRPLLGIEEEVNKHFHFEGSEALPIDTFKVLMEGTIDSITERALPFREGEEVLVKLEEPHMYNEDDAVAKIDGYLISVTSAGRNIGEQKLVRIERVGRSSAVASLVDNGVGPANAAHDDEDDDDDDSPEKPKRTRRGRRGGRGRSKPKAETADTSASAE